MISYMTLIGACCLFVGVCCVPFLFATRLVARGRMPGWNFSILGVIAALYWAAGLGMIAEEEWRFYPLAGALLMTGVIWIIGARIHFKIVELRQANLGNHPSRS